MEGRESFTGRQNSRTSVCKNLFQGAFRGWDERIFLGEMDRNFKFVGTSSCDDSYLELLFCHFEADYINSYEMVLDQWGHKLLKNLTTVTSLYEDHIQILWSLNRTILLHLRTTVFAFHFQFCRLLQ